MRELVNSLRISNDEREVLLQSETEARRRAEQEAMSRNTALERAQRELSKLTAKSTALRNECRRAKRLILEAASQIRELVNAVRSDALAAGVELAAPDRAAYANRSGKSSAGSILPSSSHDGADDLEDPELAGGDPLGVGELTSALDSIRGVLAWIHEIPRERMDLEAQVQ